MLLGIILDFLVGDSTFVIGENDVRSRFQNYFLLLLKLRKKLCVYMTTYKLLFHSMCVSMSWISERLLYDKVYKNFIMNYTVTLMLSWFDMRLANPQAIKGHVDSILLKCHSLELILHTRYNCHDTISHVHSNWKYLQITYL